VLLDNTLQNQVNTSKEMVCETEGLIVKPIRQATQLWLWSKHSTASWR